MSSDGTQERPFAVIGGGNGLRKRDLAALAEELRRLEDRQPTFEELLAAQYGLTPEQAAQLAQSIRRAAEAMQATVAEVWNAVKSALIGLAESSEWQGFVKQLQEVNRARPDLPAHRYERPRLPSQQGYNRTPYDRWRNKLGRGRRRR